MCRLIFGVLLGLCSWAVSQGAPAVPVLPIPLETYQESAGASLLEVLQERVALAPFNLVASVIFVLAICHTFLTAKFRHWAHEAEEKHARRVQAAAAARTDVDGDGFPDEVSFSGQMLHFLGEVEAVFGIWALVLVGAISYYFDWSAVEGYIGQTVDFKEPLFVVVIMAIAGTRPVLRAAEACLRLVASIGKGSAGAWWFTILTIAPVLGSLITEPAAMTIAALLLARQFYELKPSPRFAYATIGLLFVNISVGGTMTHFAAPPVLMVAAPWGWDTAFMFINFGWKAVVGIVLATTLYFLMFRRELATLEANRRAAVVSGKGETPAAVPAWITVVQLAFMGFTVMVAHYPPLFIGGFLFFLAFSQATRHHQGTMDLKAPLLVGFFLAGLVIHGGLQAWWIEPMLSRLGELPLFVGATLLTALNDNAAITYLATLVPDFTDTLKYA
ncbi:MAG TPA: putative Na+/H+ antiporter, partial [Lacunisphaera sp.]|nr:putative Na+/H+ antiporter [Lacunisphaera sp.]